MVTPATAIAHAAFGAHPQVSWVARPDPRMAKEASSLIAARFHSSDFI